MCACALPNHSALSHHWSAVCFPDTYKQANTHTHTHKPERARHPYDLTLPTGTNGGERGKDKELERDRFKERPI